MYNGVDVYFKKELLQFTGRYVFADQESRNLKQRVINRDPTNEIQSLTVLKSVVLAMRC